MCTNADSAFVCRLGNSSGKSHLLYQGLIDPRGEPHLANVDGKMLVVGGHDFSILISGVLCESIN
jgi:hypothetical protein